MRRRKLKTLNILFIFCFIIFNSSIKPKAADMNVNARAAVAIDSKTKVVLYEKNAHMIIPMASTTKIMTALVAIKYGDLDKKIEISAKSAAIHGSTVGYKKGEQIALRELIYGLMLRSGNDAAIAIAEGIGGSVDEFVRLMNEYANQIGLCSTHFESPHGLDSNNHYCTAYDLGLITIKARENPIFNEVVQTKDIDAKQYGFSRNFHNINKILWQLPNSTGVKTGYTGLAGKCLVTSVDIDKNDVVIVVLNSNERWKETKKINDYIMKNYEYKKLYSKGDMVEETEVNNGKQKVKLEAMEDIIVPINKNSGYEVKVMKPSSDILLPINKGNEFGSIAVLQDGKKVYSECLVAGNNVKPKKTIKKWFGF